MAEREAGVSTEGEIAEAIRDGARWICRAIRAGGAERPASLEAIPGRGGGEDKLFLSPRCPRHGTGRFYRDADASECTCHATLATAAPETRPRAPEGPASPTLRGRLLSAEEEEWLALRNGPVADWVHTRAFFTDRQREAIERWGLSLARGEPTWLPPQPATAWPAPLSLLIARWTGLDQQGRDALTLHAAALSRGERPAVTHLSPGEQPPTAREPVRMGDTPEDVADVDCWAERTYGSPQEVARDMAREAQGIPARRRAQIRHLRATASELAARDDGDAARGVIAFLAWLFRMAKSLPGAPEPEAPRPSCDDLRQLRGIHAKERNGVLSRDVDRWRREGWLESEGWTLTPKGRAAIGASS